MKTVTVYEAFDGTRFDAAVFCQRYEDRLAYFNKLMAKLTPRPDDMEHGTFIRQNIDTVWWLRAMVIDESCLSEALKAKVTPLIESRALPQLSIAGRYLDDVDPLAYSAWSRLTCIDSEGREWEQPYFAVNPGHGYGEYGVAKATAADTLPQSSPAT